MAQFSIAKPFGTNSILEDKKLRQRSVNFDNLCNTSIVLSIIDAEWSRKIPLGTIKYIPFCRASKALSTQLTNLSMKLIQQKSVKAATTN